MAKISNTDARTIERILKVLAAMKTDNVRVCNAIRQLKVINTKIKKQL